jgi:pimeloyl-ACP methyl ester carboxylesterase
MKTEEDDSVARSTPVDGFALAYDRHGVGDPVVLLHGWPGDRTDYDALVPLLEPSADVVVSDLRGRVHSGAGHGWRHRGDRVQADLQRQWRGAALAGRARGVQVGQTSGQPGQHVCGQRRTWAV